jgi:hypothetical protein
MMTPFPPLLIVPSLAELFIERKEYDDPFHTFSHCTLISWIIYWKDGVRWHLSHLCSLWPYWLKYLLKGWSTVIPFKLFLIVTSLYEIFIEWTEYDDTFDTFSHCAITVWSIYWVDGVGWHLSYLFSLWPHWLKYLLRGWSTMRPFKPFLIVTSLCEVFIEWMEYDDTFHTSARCDLTDRSIYWVDGGRWHLTDRSIYWGDGVRWHLSYLCSLWPHCMKYLLRGWSMMTPFTPFHIVTSLYEVFIERMEYDDTFHTSAYCGLTDWSIYSKDGVRWYLSYLFSLWPHCMKYLLRGWSTMTPFIPFLIVTSLYEVFIEGMEYDDTFQTFRHCDLTVWNFYWVDGVRWHLSYLCSLWPHCMKYLLRVWSTMTPFVLILIVTSLTELFIRGMEYDDTFHTSAHCELTDWSNYWKDWVRWHLSYLFS